MDPKDFRTNVRTLVKALGVLEETRTPCGVNLSVREAYALDAIGAGEEGGFALSQSDLQEALGIDKSNVTRLVQQLVADKRVEQRTSDEDGRIRRLHLTAKGRRIAREVEERSLQRFASVLERIPANQHAALSRAIQTFRAALDDQSKKDGP
jgi:DNA-binding MarR family transcriptional regulator